MDKSSNPPSPHDGPPEPPPLETLPSRKGICSPVDHQTMTHMWSGTYGQIPGELFKNVSPIQLGSVNQPISKQTWKYFRPRAKSDRKHLFWMHHPQQHVEHKCEQTRGKEKATPLGRKVQREPSSQRPPPPLQYPHNCGCCPCGAGK